MKQLAFSFDNDIPHFSGPWGLFGRADGRFMRFCIQLRGSHFFNNMLPAYGYSREQT